MRAGTNSRGYTVVEVMIFMAVSGLMFVIAASFISNKQAKAEFKQGMNSLSSEISAVINDVGNGYFPDRGGFSCVAVSGGINPNSPGANSQGTNLGCVFMGKIITLNPASDGTYKVYTVAGRQYTISADDGKTPISFTQATPRVVDALTEDNKFEWGIKLTKIVNDGTQNLNAIGFFTAFGKYNNGLHEASNSTVVVPLDAFSPTASMTSFDTKTDAAPNITMCFESGKGQYGTLTLGGDDGQRLATKVHIYETNPGVCS